MDAMFSPHRQQLPELPGGQGCYGNTLGKITSKIVNNCRADILNLVQRQVRNSDSGVYSIGDYGCADGTASMDLIRDVIALVREGSGVRRPVQVLYEDQHSNDFNSLFLRLHGEIPDPPTYLRQFPDVLTMATGTNFFRQCTPDNSMDLIFSFFAIHWLSRPLTGFRNSIFCCVDVRPEEREEAGRFAAEDWETFLLHRAKELKPGGLLFVAMLAQHPADTPSGYVCTAHDFCVGLERAWKQFRDEGRITQEEFENTVASEFYRRPEEVSAPFSSPDSPVRRAGLALKSLQNVRSPCPFKAEWQKLLGATVKDTRVEATRKLVERNRVWSSNVIENGLSPERKNGSEIIDALYKAVEDYILEMPFESVRNDHVVTKVVIIKENSNETALHTEKV